MTNISRVLNGEGLALHEESYYKGAREGVICLGFVLGEIALAKTSSVSNEPILSVIESGPGSSPLQ